MDRLGDRIVAMHEFNGRLLIATPDHVYDITDKENPVVIFNAEAAEKMTIGKTYVMTEQL
jgi:hypothetical protein